MKTAKKLLSVVLTACMVLALLPATALADGIPTINFTVSGGSGPAAPYGSLADAIGGANGGDTITLSSSSGDLDLIEAVTIDKNLTLDLNTHTLNLSSTVTVVTVVAGGNLTVTNGVLNVIGEGGEAALAVDGGTLTLGANDASNPKIHVTGVNMGLTVVNGGKATVTSVTANGDNCTGVQAKVGANAAVIVKGDVTVSGENSCGVEVSGSSNSVTVEGSISATGINCIGANASGHGAVTIQGDVNVDGDGGVCNSGLCASGGGSVAVNGNVTVSAVSGGQIFCGAVASGTGSVVTVKGNITVTGNAGVGAMAWGGTITVNGNVSAYIGAQTDADAGENSLITINGDILAAADYIRIGSESKTVAAGVIGTDENSGYLVYTDPTVAGTQTVRVKAPVMNAATGVYYPSLTDALIAAADGDTIKLLKDITESVEYSVDPGKFVTIDGQGFTLTGVAADQSVALVLVNDGVVILKDIILQGGQSGTNPNDTSCGLRVVNSVSVQSVGTVKAQGGSGTFSVGLYNFSSGIVNITEASAGVATGESYGVRNEGNTDSHNLVNVKTITGGTGSASFGVLNYYMNTVNVTTANGGAGMTTKAVWNYNSGTVNVSVLNGSASGGTVNTGTGNNVATITLNKGTGASCVLDTVTVAKTGTPADQLPSVYKDGGWGEWFTDSAKKTLYAGGPVTDGMNLYSTFYTAPVAPPATGGGTTTTTPTTTVSGTTATTTVTPTVSGGKATGSVTADQMSDALKKAQAAAGASGTPNVTIQVSGASGAGSVATTIPHASLQSLVSGGVGALTVSGPTGSVSFDAAALKTLAGAPGDVTVTIARTDSAALSDAARALVGSHPVFTFSVTGGGSAITQFGGDVTVSVPYALAAGEDPNAIVIYYIAADGTPTLVQDARYDAATGTVVFTTTHFSTYAVGYNKVGFTDVALGAWYHDAVTFLAARGITSGTTATTFGPDGTLTRGQFITMLLRAYGVAAVTNPTDNFSDAGSTYYTGYLAAAKGLGITAGVGNNKFAPDQAITRQEMFTLLYNALKAFDKLPSGTSGKTLADFTDAGSIASWAQTALAALVGAGTVTGSGGKLSPTDTTTRGEMAQVLYNLLKAE